MMSTSTSKDKNPRKSDAVARTVGKTATAGGGREGSNPGPSAIGGKNDQNQVILFTDLILLTIGYKKFLLQHTKKLATEPSVHCSFFKTNTLVFPKCTHNDSTTITEQQFIYTNLYKYLANYYLNYSLCNELKIFYFESFLNIDIIISIYALGIYLLILSDKISSILILQVRAKRAVDEKLLDDSSNERKKRRGDRPKMKYADVARLGHIMVEVRASNLNVELGQPDYDNIEHHLALTYVNLPAPRPPKPPQVHSMGLSNGGLWVGALDEFTHQFMLVHVPTYLMPPGTGVYDYEVYGPDNRPYKYYKTTAPVRFWGSRKNLEDIIKAFHPELETPLLDRHGNEKIPHFRISSGMEHSQEIVRGYFPLVIETEESLAPALGRLNGVLTILSSTLRLVGGGIEKSIAEAKAAEATAAAEAAAAAEAEATAEAETTDEIIDIDHEDMEHEPASSTIPLAPPPPTSRSQLLPPTPLITRQMAKRTPPTSNINQDE